MSVPAPTGDASGSGAGNAAMATASELLAAHAFLRGIPERHLSRLSYWSRRTVFHAGTRVFNEGGKADRFWLIRSGEVQLDARLPLGKPVVIDTLGPDTVLGWSWLFPPCQWRFGATAMSAVLAMEFDATGVRRLFEASPDLGYDLTRRFMSIMTDRLQSTRFRLLDALTARPAGSSTPDVTS